MVCDGEALIAAITLQGGTVSESTSREFDGAAVPVRAEPIEGLRQEVSLLGYLLGDVLREQAGEVLYRAVEFARQEMINARTNGRVAETLRRLQQWFQSLSDEELFGLIRAFGIYFHLINLAEQHHRVRTLRHREQTAQVLHESIEAALLALRERGVTSERLAKLLPELLIFPVFTAHPSEPRRRTVLQRLAAIAALIRQLDDVRLAPREREWLLERLREEITLLWQTAETRIRRPMVLDEVRSSVAILVGSVYDVVSLYRRAFQRALGRTYPDLPSLSWRLPLRIGTWVGGDRDGNPAVTPAVTLATARLMREAIVRRYREEVAALRRALSISARLRGVTPELSAAIEQERELLGVMPVRAWADEPYRRMLGIIEERLRRTETGEPGAYMSAGEFLSHLYLVAHSLQRHGGQRIAEGQIADLIARVELFGFHLAELEIRQDAARHRAALAELFALVGRTGYEDLGKEERERWLRERIHDGVFAPLLVALSPQTREVIETFEVMATIQRLNGERACQTVIVSMTSEPADVLGTLVLAREAGLCDWLGEQQARSRIDVVPLFEQMRELEECGALLAHLLQLPEYRAIVRARKDQQEIMLGYSDSTKDGGYTAANWRIYQAEENLSRVAGAAGVSLRLFYGRGGAIGRGGGPMGRAIQARAPAARSPSLKVTEQGEVIFARYSDPAIALRHWEQMTHALLLSALNEVEPPLPERWRGLMDQLAQRAQLEYERFVKGTPEVATFFLAATPFPELASLNLASRPVARQKGEAQSIQFGDLRAIPWVFSWTQCRVNLPGWYGLGCALEWAWQEGYGTLLQEMYQKWLFFAMLIDNAQISLATADLSIGELYADLAGNLSGLFKTIRREYERTVRSILVVTGQKELLAGSPILARLIKLRNPYVDALHIAQVTLLDRFRNLAEKDSPRARRLLDMIHHSINAIAAGLQTTG